MTNSSQPKNLSEELASIISDEITITLDSNMSSGQFSCSDTITLGPFTAAGAQPTYTFASGASSMVGVNSVSIDNSSFIFNLPEEWVDAFPDWDRVQDMCKQYPGLDVALRNFQTVYNLVKDDYDNPVPKR